MSAKPWWCIKSLPFIFSPQEKSTLDSTLYICAMSPNLYPPHSTLLYKKKLKRRRKKPKAMTSNKNTAATRATVAVVLLLLATTLLATVAHARPYLDVLPPSTSHGVVGNLLPHKIIPPSGPSDFWGGGDEPPLPPVEAKINHGN